MDIKTDWTPDDYYNIHDDLTRTEGNIHEIAAVLSAAGRPATLNEKLNWTMQDFPTDEEMNRIVGNINALRTATNAPELPEPQPFYSEEYVTADRINDLESCIQRAYWTSVHTPPVQESGRKLLADSTAAVILCVDTGFQAAYPSAYTGQQIDAFVAQMKEWNNGQL